jgi:hypothetical protein
VNDLKAREWGRFGHSLVHIAERMLVDPTATAVFNVLGTSWYVQWHGEHDAALYLEAASGLYNDRPLDKAQQDTLAHLGWDAPGEGWGKDSVLNWSRLFTPPVSLYDAVRLTVATLRDVFAATPATVQLH